ncbi:MAG: VC2046/SO_2500 family protein [Thalassotalea sp.]
MEVSQVLINEIELGTALNQCVQQERRSDFSLMLAMLTEDAREFSEFNLPEQADVEKRQDEEQLRRLFNLPKPQPLALAQLDDIDSFNQAHLVNDMNEIHFRNSLKPKALAFRDDVKHISSNILSNTSLHTQKRYHSENKVTTAKLAFNTNEWLNTIEQSIVNQQVAVTA